MKRADGGDSKTMWFSLIFLLFSVAGFLAEQAGYLDFEASKELILIADAIIAILAMVLRHLTKQPMA
jgi:hypothetical protein